MKHLLLCTLLAACAAPIDIPSELDTSTAGGPAHVHGHASALTPPGVYVDLSTTPQQINAGSSTFDVVTPNPLQFPPAAGDGVGAFRNVCEISHINHDDPIVYPGQKNAAHAHQFWGNTKARYDSTTPKLKSDGKSTCRGGTANKSAYWMPVLVGPDSKPVLPQEVHTYYKSEYFGLTPAQITTMPWGIRLISGTMSASPTAPQDLARAGWKCVNGGTKSHTPPSCPGDMVEAYVFFPQCWNGQLDSPDHKSHVVFPVPKPAPQTGFQCPTSHPHGIPGLSYHMRWNSIPAGSRWSSDTYSGPGGYGGHGDFMEAWDNGVAGTFLQKCVREAKDCGSHMLGDGRIIQ